MTACVLADVFEAIQRKQMGAHKLSAPAHCESRYVQHAFSRVHIPFPSFGFSDALSEFPPTIPNLTERAVVFQFKIAGKINTPFQTDVLSILRGLFEVFLGRSVDPQ